MENSKEMIAQTIKKLGIPAHLLGYDYIRYGVEIMLEQGHLKKSITKYLYPKIAKKFGTTSSRVERDIRNAVEIGFVRCDKKFMENMFCVSLDYKPTNAEFIATVADYVSLKIECEEA